MERAKSEFSTSADVERYVVAALERFVVVVHTCKILTFMPGC